MAIMVDPTIVLTAFVGTSIVFGCFSLAAIFGFYVNKEMMIRYGK